MSAAIQTAQADFDKAVPLLQVVNSLADTYAGNIYRKIAGAVEKVQAWDENHPEVQAAADAIGATVSTVFPGAGFILPAVGLAQHVLGALGKLMAQDPTVAGPQAPPSVQGTVAAAGGAGTASAPASSTVAGGVA